MTGDSQRGFTLIEVVVAMFVLTVVMTGAAATVIAVMGAVQVNETRAVASNAIQADLERLRSLPFDELEARVESTESDVIELDGRRFGIERTFSFADLEADADRCTVDIDNNDERQLIRVDVAAWPTSRPQQLSTTSTTLARPPLDGLDPGSGSMTVVVLDHQAPPQPVPFAQVELRRDGEDAFFTLEDTGEQGCVLFHNQPTGNYEVRVSKPNPAHIGIQPGPDQEAPIRTASVAAAGTNTTVEVRYAPQAFFDLVSVVPGVTPVDQFELPDDLEVTIERAGATVNGPVGEPLGPIWPGIWNAWAGTCPAADPLGQLSDGDGEDAALLPIWEDASRGDPVAAGAGEDTALDVPIAVVRLVDAQPTPEPLFASRTIITAVDTTQGTADTSCQGSPTNPLVFDFQRDVAVGGDPNASVTLGLPFGDWELDVQRPNGTSNGTSIATAVVELHPNSIGQQTDVTAVREP